MARNKKGSEEQGGNWMDTYGDMVTLLLTFFVMLYASSTIDEEKWQMIVEAFTPAGSIINPVPDNDSSGLGEENLNDDLAPGELPQTFDQLFQYLQHYVKDKGLEEHVGLEKGEASIYMKFKNDIFFEGDESAILPTGKKILDGVGTGLKAVEDDVLSVKVCGHTALIAGSSVDSTFLSSDRACNVSAYLRDEKGFAPGKLVSSGYGGYRPIAPNDTEENRSLNRRVEIIMIRSDIDFNNPDIIEELLQLEYGINQRP